MNPNNAISLLLGTVLGGVATYFALKHQDSIIEKINDLEKDINLDRSQLVQSAKEKLDALTTSAQATFQKYARDSNSEKSSAEITAIMEEIHRLHEEIDALKGAEVVLPSVS